jgi:hypothetical protein
MRKLILFCFTVLLPALVVGISNFTVFPDSAIAATIMLIITVGAAAIFTWQSGNATPKIARYCVCADFVICAILCLNLAGHWILAREVSAAKQGVEERNAEEDRQLEREKVKTDLEIARNKSATDLARAEARRLAQLPPSERRSSPAPKPKPTQQPTAVPIVAPMALTGPGATVSTMAPRLTPDQVRDSWWWYLTGLAIAEVFASILAGAILAGIWEWDRNKDGIADHLQQPQAAPGK